MNPARVLLGIHVPGDTLWHRLGPGVKYLVFLALAIPALAGGDVRLSLGLLAAALVLVATTGAPLRLAWGLPWGLVLLLAVMAGVQALLGQWWLGVTICCGLLTALYGSRLLLLTTPMPVLIDALIRLVRPLRRLGLDPERFGLAVAVMIRSVPYIAGAFGDVRQAAAARGLDRNPLAQVAPVVVQTVAYARATGEALAARGLGESADGDG